MNLHTVVTAANNNPLYRDYIPVFLRAWSKLFPDINVRILMVGDQDPDYNHPGIINIETIPGVHPGFHAQCIRLLWPAIAGNTAGFSDGDAVLTTDIDMIPMSRGYYTETISNYSDDKFVCLRNVIDHLQQYPICYNIATPATWKKVFRINNKVDIIERLEKWYNETTYDGEHGGKGWNFDQTKLFKSLNSWNECKKRENEPRLILLKDRETGFKRLDRMHTREIMAHLPQVLKMTARSEFTDFHMLRPYREHKETIEKIVDSL